MKESSSDFRDTLLELIDSSPAPADHPSPDRWLAYHRGEVSSEEEESLQEHLARCRDCFDLSAAAAAFAQPEEEGAGEEMETAAAWRLLRPQLEPLPPNVREISASPRRPPAWKTWLPSTLAASFFVALLGLSGWNVRLQRDLLGLSGWNLSLQRDLETAQAPRPVTIADFPSGERLIASENVLTTDEAPWALVLHPEAERRIYRLTLRDAASEKELWSLELRPDEDGALTILVPELRPGRYRLDLSDPSGKGVPEKQFLRVTGPNRGD